MPFSIMNMPGSKQFLVGINVYSGNVKVDYCVGSELYNVLEIYIALL